MPVYRSGFLRNHTNLLSVENGKNTEESLNNSKTFCVTRPAYYYYFFGGPNIEHNIFAAI